MHVQNAKVNQYNTAVRDAFNKIGSKLISLSAQVKCQKQETQYY